MTVGQINLSRENRFLSNSVNCTELERKKCYFSTMKRKQDLSLFTLSSPFQKVSLMPSLKKKISSVVYRKTLGSFRAGNHTLELCAFSLWPKIHMAGLNSLLLWRCHKCWEWERQRVRTESGDVGCFAIGQPPYRQPVSHPNHWAWNVELLNLSPLHSRPHT